MGCSNPYSISFFIKKESDFNWLAKPPRRKLFKIIPLNDLQAHLVIVKLLKELGSNIKEKRTILLRLVQDSKTQLISLDGM